MVLAESKNRVGLGRALMNSRGGSGGRRVVQAGRGGRRGKGVIEQSFSSAERKEADWYKIRSITEQNDLDEFLATAQLADTDFTAERHNVQVVRDHTNPYLLSPDAEARTLKKHKAHHSALTVPRRPAWDSDTTPAELDKAERESFLQWRRGLADLSERNDLLLTPFERNLEVWRQMWRVIERSDLVVQIVDARNPLLFRCEDLEAYVKEVDPKKTNLLLVNKADLMTTSQRRAWAEYFEKEGIRYRFFSAALAKEGNEQDDSEEEYEEYEEYGDDEEDEEEGEEDEEEGEEDEEKVQEVREGSGEFQARDTSKGNEDAEDGGISLVPQSAEPLVSELQKIDLKEKTQAVNDETEIEDPRIKILTVNELEAIFLGHTPDHPPIGSPGKPHKTTIGLVGYPNVGKSSTINALMGSKKVSVSATPGKTKHFQTLHLSDKIMLCDCPGLVFPNFASTKADLVCNGILPIDQQREYTAPAELVAQRIPRWYLERVYGIRIGLKALEEGGSGRLTGEELLVAYARARGFMKTGAGLPDDSRAARYVLKDFVNGRLLFCQPPPIDPPISPTEFNADIYANTPRTKPAHQEAHPEGARMVYADEDDIVPLPSAVPEGAKTRGIDKAFFAQQTSGNAGHIKTPFQRGVPLGDAETGRLLSGRKAKTVVAIDNNLSPDEVRALMGSKKHFKGRKRRKQKAAAE